MKYILVVIGFLVSGSGYSQLMINDPNAEERVLSEFHSIRISGGINLLLTKGNIQGVAVSNTKRERNSDIITEVKNDVLFIKMSPGLRSFGSRSDPRAYVSYTILEELNVSGACDVKFADAIVQDRLVIKLEGASNLKGKVRVSRLSVNLSGASDALLEGISDELKLNCSGASDFKSYGLSVKRCDANLSGSSDVRISVQDALTVRASGASNLFYKGYPGVTVHTSGSSNVVRKY